MDEISGGGAESHDAHDGAHHRAEIIASAFQAFAAALDQRQFVVIGFGVARWHGETTDDGCAAARAHGGRTHGVGVATQRAARWLGR